MLNSGENFNALDSAENGELDGKISRDDLEIIAADENADPELREAARALMENDNHFNAFDVADADERDGIIGRDDVSNVYNSPEPEWGRQWGADEDAALRRAFFDGGGEFTDLFDGVHQTDRGNCASVAVIKAAMDHFGNEVFQSVERTEDGGYNVTLRDGEQVSLTREEMEAAATGAHLEGDDPEARAYAVLCFGVMAKRAQEMGHEGADTYAEALLSLSNGEYAEEVPEYLGLADRVQEVDLEDVPSQDGVVAWGNGHAVYVDSIGGKTYTDSWGNQKDYDGTNEVNKDDNELEQAFIFV